MLLIELSCTHHNDIPNIFHMVQNVHNTEVLCNTNHKPHPLMCSHGMWLTGIQMGTYIHHSKYSRYSLGLLCNISNHLKSNERNFLCPNLFRSSQIWVERESLHSMAHGTSYHVSMNSTAGNPQENRLNIADTQFSVWTIISF